MLIPFITGHQAELVGPLAPVEDVCVVLRLFPVDEGRMVGGVFTGASRLARHTWVIATRTPRK